MSGAGRSSVWGAETRFRLKIARLAHPDRCTDRVYALQTLDASGDGRRFTRAADVGHLGARAAASLALSRGEAGVPVEAGETLATDEDQHSPERLSRRALSRRCSTGRPLPRRLPKRRPCP